jgi:uncharacterized protein (TIRG00374 family)
MRALIISVIVAAAGYLGFSLWGGWDEVMAALAQVSWLLIGLLLCLSLVNYGLRFVRWQYYLHRFGHHVPWWPSLRIYLGGFALTTTPGKAGEALRSVLLLPRGVSWPHSLAALLAERLGDLLAILLLAAIGLAAYPQGGGVLWLMGALVVALLWLVQQHRLLGRLRAWLAQRFSGRLAAMASGSIDTILHSSTLFSMPLLGGSILLGLVAWGAEGLALYYLLQAMGAEVSLATALFIYAFSMLVGAISFLPGGLGSAEITMMMLLSLHGMSPAEAVAATVIIRLATLWFAVLLGLLALLPIHRSTLARS